MKKIILMLVNFVSSFGLMQQSFGQNETFDIIHYTAPKDWKKDAKVGVLTYTNVNATTGGFCVIALYSSSTSLGEPDKDFKNEWQNLVITPYKAEPNPKTETQSNDEGWQVVAGAAGIKLEGIDAMVVLTVISGFGKVVSVLATLNDQDYLKNIDELLANMKLDKISPIAIQKQASITQNNTNMEKFGSVLYTTPAGWKVQLYEDGVIWTATGLPAGEFLIMQLMQPINFSGTMEQALQKTYDDVCVSLKASKMNEVNGGNYSKLEPKKSFRGWEYIRCNGGIRMGEGQTEYGLDIFVMKINNRFERVYSLKSRNNCNLSRYYPSDRLNFHNDIEKFLFSLKFTDWQEPAIKAGSLKGEGIVGVWQGRSMKVGTPKPGAPLGADLKVSNTIFFSNGQAYFGTKFPIEGLDELNTWINAENNRRDWGTYTFSNGKGILKMPYADIPMRWENNKLVITTNKTDHGFIKINGVDGAKFDGTYSFSGQDILGNETGKTPTIQFFGNGNFKDDGAVNVMFHEYVDCINLAKQPGTGIYEVENHSLIFNYADGRKIKIAFIGTGYNVKNKSPNSLSVSANEDVLAKQ